IELLLGALDAVMRWQIELITCALGPQLELNTWARGPGAAVFDVMSEGFLPAVEVDGGNALAGLEQRHRDMQRCCRLARATLFIAEHDHVRRRVCLLSRLVQHDV